MDLVFPANVRSLSDVPKNTQMLIFVYSPTCPWCIKKAPEFSQFSKNYTGPLQLCSLNVKKVPIHVNSVPVIVGSNSKGTFYISDADAPLQDQLKAASNFALENK